MALEGPTELLELAAGESRSFTVTAAEMGETIITPRDGRAPKRIDVLRVQVDPADKPLFPHYYDITATTLIAQLKPQLVAGGLLPRRLTVTKVGSGPAARFSVESAPAQAAPTP